MTPILAFSATAATWQNFYLLTGTAAATLIGLMFVAVTFGASAVTAQSATTSARAFLDPPFTHFVTVLFVACLMLIPSMTPPVLGVAIVTVTALRTVALVGIFRRMREAHERFGDIELSDWLMGILVPLACYLGLLASGAGFLAGMAVAFTALVVAIIVVLLLGVFAAWELVLWMALTRLRAQEKNPA